MITYKLHMADSLSNVIEELYGLTSLATIK